MTKLLEETEVIVYDKKNLKLSHKNKFRTTAICCVQRDNYGSFFYADALKFYRKYGG